MSYLAPIAVFLMVLSPLLLPALITGCHAAAGLRRRPIGSPRIVVRRPAAAVAAAS